MNIWWPFEARRQRQVLTSHDGPVPRMINLHDANITLKFHWPIRVRSRKDITYRCSHRPRPQVTEATELPAANTEGKEGLWSQRRRTWVAMMWLR